MTVEELIQDPQTLVVLNHSGGKDSQAMELFIRRLVPAHRYVIIHAHLPEVEWPGIEEHIRTTTDGEFHIVQAGKTFFEMVESRQMFPSPKYRQCTSDLKRGPIAKKIRQLTTERGFTRVLNCMGLRAQESSARAKKPVFKVNKRQTNSKREWYDWLPIHDWTEEAVFDYITSNGQEPHWAYGAGMSRLSCCFCIMSSKEDIRTAARLNPELFQRYAETERRLGFSMLMPGKGEEPKFLDQIVTPCTTTQSVT